MRLPKSIIICGKRFKILTDKKQDGGSFRESTRTILVGTKFKEYIIEILTHEVIEAIFAISGMRYKAEYNGFENGDLLFSFNHKEFENAIRNIVFAFQNINFKENHDADRRKRKKRNTGRRNKKAQ